jgi:hypothetical protein
MLSLNTAAKLIRHPMRKDKKNKQVNKMVAKG